MGFADFSGILLIQQSLLLAGFWYSVFLVLILIRTDTDIVGNLVVVLCSSWWLSCAALGGRFFLALGLFGSVL